MHANQRRNIIRGSKDQTGAIHSAMTRLAILWNHYAISFPVQIKLYRSLILSILLCECESWILTVNRERRIQAFENKCCRRMLGISYREHKTNEYFTLCGSKVLNWSSSSSTFPFIHMLVNGLGSMLLRSCFCRSWFPFRILQLLPPAFLWVVGVLQTIYVNYSESNTA